MKEFGEEFCLEIKLGMRLSIIKSKWRQNSCVVLVVPSLCFFAKRDITASSRALLYFSPSIYGPSAKRAE